MNDGPDSLPEPGEDPMLEEAISFLKRLEPPLQTRIANRMAVAAELSALRTVSRQRLLPWWRRSISIPVPILAGAIVLSAFVLQSSLRGWQERSRTHVDAPDQAAGVAAGVGGKKTAIAKRAPDARAELEYYETETYVCGIGRVSSESRYFIKE